MKVIFASNAYWPSIGGIENSLKHLSQECIKLGGHPEIIVSDIGLKEYKATEVVDDILVHRYKLKPYKYILLNFIFSNLNAIRIFKNKFKENPNTIIIARFHLSVIHAYIAGFRNIKYVVPSIIKYQCAEEKTNNNYLKKIKKNIWSFLHNYLQKKALNLSEIYVFSESMREQCLNINHKANDIVVTKPGVSPIRFHPSDVEKNETRDKLNISKNKKVILFIGRFVKAKRVDLLINAFSKLDNAILVLVGKGDEEENYRSLINELDILDKVRIIPACSDVEKYYRASDVFVMSSSYEPLGQTIIEAFSSGLPVVAFKNSECVNTATEELGMDEFIYYAENFSSEELFHALKKALSIKIDPTSIHIKAINKFSWNNLYKELVQV